MPRRPLSVNSDHSDKHSVRTSSDYNDALHSRLNQQGVIEEDDYDDEDSVGNQIHYDYENQNNRARPATARRIDQKRLEDIIAEHMVDDQGRSRKEKESEQLANLELVRNNPALRTVTTDISTTQKQNEARLLRRLKEIDAGEVERFLAQHRNASYARAAADIASSLMNTRDRTYDNKPNLRNVEFTKRLANLVLQNAEGEPSPHLPKKLLPLYQKKLSEIQHELRRKLAQLEETELLPILNFPNYGAFRQHSSYKPNPLTEQQYRELQEKFSARLNSVKKEIANADKFIGFPQPEQIKELLPSVDLAKQKFKKKFGKYVDMPPEKVEKEKLREFLQLLHNDTKDRAACVVSVRDSIRKHLAAILEGQEQLPPHEEIDELDEDTNACIREHEKRVNDAISFEQATVGLLNELDKEADSTFSFSDWIGRINDLMDKNPRFFPYTIPQNEEKPPEEEWEKEIFPSLDGFLSDRRTGPSALFDWAHRNSGALKKSTEAIKRRHGWASDTELPYTSPFITLEKLLHHYPHLVKKSDDVREWSRPENAPLRSVIHEYIAAKKWEAAKNLNAVSPPRVPLQKDTIYLGGSVPFSAAELEEERARYEAELARVKEEREKFLASIGSWESSHKNKNDYRSFVEKEQKEHEQRFRGDQVAHLEAINQLASLDEEFERTRKEQGATYAEQLSAQMDYLKNKYVDFASKVEAPKAVWQAARQGGKDFYAKLAGIQTAQNKATEQEYLKAITPWKLKLDEAIHQRLRENIADRVGLIGNKLDYQSLINNRHLQYVNQQQQFNDHRRNIDNEARALEEAIQAQPSIAQLSAKKVQQQQEIDARRLTNEELTAHEKKLARTDEALMRQMTLQRHAEEYPAASRANFAQYNAANTQAILNRAQETQDFNRGVGVVNMGANFLSGGYGR